MLNGASVVRLPSEGLQHNTGGDVSLSPYLLAPVCLVTLPPWVATASRTAMATTDGTSWSRKENQGLETRDHSAIH